MGHGRITAPVIPVGDDPIARLRDAQLGTRTGPLTPDAPIASLFTVPSAPASRERPDAPHVPSHSTGRRTPSRINAAGQPSAGKLPSASSPQARRTFRSNRSKRESSRSGCQTAR